MKIATYEQNGTVQIGVVQGDSVYPVKGLPHNEMAVLAGEFERYLGSFEHAITRSAVPIGDVRFKAPVTRPGKIMAIGLNYADHIRESSLPWPEQQTWFCKQISALNGPFDPIEIPRASDTLDYEAELVVVIGRGGRHITRDDAPSHVLGFCAGNDVSVRGWQLATSQWVLGKSFDTHAPIGPWITTIDEVPDPHGLNIRCYVNGEERQNSNTRELVFDVWSQIEHLSAAMTLLPGDLIFTGTPGGVGFARNPPVKLREGDRVRVEIEKLGHVENLCKAE